MNFYRQALELDPENVDALVARGALYNRSGLNSVAFDGPFKKEFVIIIIYSLIIFIIYIL